MSIEQDRLDEEEAQRRFEELLKAGLKTPPMPLKEKAREPKPPRKAPYGSGKS
jgi:hypothetical protein